MKNENEKPVRGNETKLQPDGRPKPLYGAHLFLNTDGTKKKPVKPDIEY